MSNKFADFFGAGAGMVAGWSVMTLVLAFGIPLIIGVCCLMSCFFMAVTGSVIATPTP